MSQCGQSGNLYVAPSPELGIAKGEALRREMSRGGRLESAQLMGELPGAGNLERLRVALAAW